MKAAVGVLAVTSTVAVTFAAAGWLCVAALVSLLDEQMRRCRGCVR